MTLLRHSGLALFARIAVGAVLVFSATTKLAHPAEFAVAVQAYDVVPPDLARNVATALPWIELLVGSFVLFGALARIAIPIAALMLGFFLALMAVAWVQGKTVDCGCFVGVVQETVGPVALARDFVVLGLLLPAFLAPPHRLSLDPWLRSATTARIWRAIAPVALGGVAIVFGLFISGFAAGSDAGLSRQPVIQPPASPTNVAPPIADSRQQWRVGSTTARVVITEFGDYQCGACRAIVPVLKQLVAEYRGEVALVYRHFPLPGHNFAVPAAEAAEAAGEQGKFWEMHDLLYADQQRLTPQDIRARAVYLGLDLKRFDEAISSGRARNQVRADYDEGSRIGISYTPWVLVNNQVVQPNSYQSIKAAVERELRR